MSRPVDVGEICTYDLVYYNIELIKEVENLLSKPASWSKVQSVPYKTYDRGLYGLFSGKDLNDMYKVMIDEFLL